MLKSLSCQDQYICRGLRLWNSRDRETVYKCMQSTETMKHSGLWSSLGTHGSLVVMWWLYIPGSGEIGNLIFKLYLTLKILVNCPLNNRDFNQGILHLCSKVGDPSLKGSWVITWTSKWLTHKLTHTHTHTHRCRQRQYRKAKTGLG